MSEERPGGPVERLVGRLRELSKARWDRDAWERETTVRIPAEPERDIDLVLSTAAGLIERMAAALSCAADALDIAADWNVDHVQANPPREWALEAGGEDANEGWCLTRALAEKLRELTQPPNAEFSGRR